MVMRKLAERHPLTLFFVLAAALSWWPWPFYAAGLSWVPIAGFGPFLAAATVLGLTRGRAGIESLLRSMVRWRVPLRAYLLALGTPLLLTGAAVALNLWLGASRPSAALLGAWVEIPVTMMFILLVPGLGGAWEEPGFRGFALGRLERQWGQMTAPLVLGVLWVIWRRRRERTPAGRPDAAEVAEHVGIAVGQHPAPEPTGSVTSLRTSRTGL